jgi:hypothetical protein
MSASHYNLGRLRGIWDLSWLNVGISMTGIPTDGEHHVLFGTENEVLIALLLERVHHDLGGQCFRKRVVLIRGYRSNKISHFLIDIDNDVNITLSTPLIIFLSKFNGQTVCDNMGGWFLFDEIEVCIKAQMGVEIHIGVLWLNNNLHGSSCSSHIGFKWDIVFQNLSGISVESHL